MSLGTIHTVKTRVGRIVKPVNRLIEVMTNKADINQLFDKVAKSVFNVFQ